jgi:hypothetical protein
VTGVTIDEADSYDNQGEDWTTKLGEIAAANTWPQLIWNGNGNDIAEAGLAYDISGLVADNCPTLEDAVSAGLMPQPINQDNTSQDYGKDFYLAFGAQTNTYTAVPGADPDMAPGSSLLEAYNMAYNQPTDTLPNFQMRDDILTTLYPQAKTEQQIQDLYVSQGSFQLSDLLDVPINSLDDFYNMLYAIKNLNLTQNGQPVYATYATNGTDSSDDWMLMDQFFGGLLGAGSATMYTYWSRSQDSIQFYFEQPFFKQQLKEWAQMVRDGVCDPSAFTDTSDIIKANQAAGQYAVLYGWYPIPTQASLQAQGYNFQYRKVYMNLPVNQNEFCIWTGGISTRSNLEIVKSAVTQDQLMQILRWYDYMLSDAAAQMMSWGPASAGLYTTDANGLRTFTDATLEQEMTTGASALATGSSYAGSETLKYNLTNGYSMFTPASGLFVSMMNQNANKFAPVVVTPIVATADGANNAFYAGFYMPAVAQNQISQWPDDWCFPAQQCPLINQATASANGTALTNALIKCLTATSDDQFETYWTDLLTTANQMGWTEAAREEVDAYFKAQNTTPVTSQDYLAALAAPSPAVPTPSPIPGALATVPGAVLPGPTDWSGSEPTS